MRQSVGSRRVRHDLATKQQTEKGEGARAEAVTGLGSNTHRGPRSGCATPSASLCLQPGRAGKRGVQ